MSELFKDEGTSKRSSRRWLPLALVSTLLVGVLIGVLLARVLLGQWPFGASKPQPNKTAAPTADCRKAPRPYAASSPWNTPIGDNVARDPKSDEYIETLASAGKPLTSDPDQYTIPVYCIDSATQQSPVQLAGYYSSYNSAGVRKGHGYAPLVDAIPVPQDVQAGAGTDGQVVFWDSKNGVEYAFWQFAKKNGEFTATNGYRTGTTEKYQGRFPDGLAGRGAGLPYLAGLVRPEEVKSGRIEHALAFAYQWPSKAHVYPASKSDGLGKKGVDLPEGTRLQLDPSLTEVQLRELGITTKEGLVIAKALQEYGMYVVDNSGSSKIYLEDRKTAEWKPEVTRDLMGEIPWAKFRAVAPPTDK